MADPGGLPGPPPAPPADFSARPLPTVSIAAGTLLYRIHRTQLEPLFFGPRRDPAERGRWDAPDDEYGVCYLAEQPYLAFAETLLRNLALEEVGRETLSVRSLAQVEVLRDLTLAQMHGRGLRRMRATAAVVHGSYAAARPWSLAIHEHPDAVDGLRYHARHDDDELSVALFDRAAGALALRSSTPLLDPVLAPDLGAWLDRYRVALGP